MVTVFLHSGDNCFVYPDIIREIPITNNIKLSLIYYLHNIIILNLFLNISMITIVFWGSVRYWNPSPGGLSPRIIVIKDIFLFDCSFGFVDYRAVLWKISVVQVPLCNPIHEITE